MKIKGSLIEELPWAEMEFADRNIGSADLKMIMHIEE